MATETLLWSTQTTGTDQQLAVLGAGTTYTSIDAGVSGSVNVTATLLPGDEIQTDIDYNYSGPGYDYDTDRPNAGELTYAEVYTGAGGTTSGAFLLVNNGVNYTSPAGVSHTVTARFDFATNDNLTYANGVENLSFWLGGMSGNAGIDQVRITAYAPDGTTLLDPAPIQFLSAGSNVGTGISGTTATVTAGPSAAGVGSASGAVQVVFTAPVGRIDIAYYNLGTLGQLASISDFTFDTIPLSPSCFAAGTGINTPCGPVPVEALAEGDYVMVAGGQPMPVRWVGHRRFAAKGALAPIFISKGVLGNTRDLLVSPAHRMLVSGLPVAALFGDSEVLVPASALVDGDRIYRKSGGEVDYYHILLDRHEVIFAEGAPCESLFLGADGSELSAFEQAALDEVQAIFPELSMPVARPVLNLAEAALLTSFAAL